MEVKSYCRIDSLMQFIRKKQLLNRLLIGDGIGRAGKSLLCHVLTGFKRVEKISYYNCLEFISLGHYHKKISNDMAVAILRTELDTHVFDQMNGRNVNTRPDDYSSINNYHTPQKYIDRQDIDKTSKVEYHGNPNAGVIENKIQQEQPIFLTFAHDLIFKSKPVFEAFEDKVRLIYLNRLPVDLLYEWHVKDFGERIGNDPTETDYLISINNKSIPEYAHDWPDEYLSITPLERIIKIIYTCFKRNYLGLEEHKHDDRVKIIEFEELITTPSAVVDDLSKYLNLDILDCMNNILKENNCPRELNNKEYADREKYIINNISGKYKSLLDEMSEIHQKISKLK